MPNRILKESICCSDSLDQLTAQEEVFFYRLIVQADDYGRMDARATVLRARCFPLRLNKVKDSDVVSWTEALVKAGVINLYSVDNRPFLQFKTWERHQQVRAKKSKYPQMISDDNTCNQMISDDNKCPRNPIQSNPNPYPNPIQCPATELPEWIDKTLWNDFLEMRKKIRKPATERAIKILITKLTKLKNEGNDPSKVLEQSIVKSWQDLFELRDNTQKPAHIPGQRVPERYKTPEELLAEN